MDVTVNLANHPYLDSRPIVRALRMGIALVATLAIGASVALYFLHQRAQAVRGKAQAIESSIEYLLGEQRAYRIMMHSTNVVEVIARADELNSIFDAKGFSWTAVMKNLESVLPKEVQVTSIEPMRTKDGNTTLHLRVVGAHEKSIDLLRKLEATRLFLQPRIVGESLAETKSSGQTSVAIGPSTMMEFDLLTEYSGDSTARVSLVDSTHPLSMTQTGDTIRPSPSRSFTVSATQTFRPKPKRGR